MERKLIAEIESLLGNKPFGRTDLLALANHVHKPVYKSFGLIKLIQFSGKNTSQKKNLRITMDVVQETVYTSSEMEFVAMVKILLGCYLLDIKQIEAEEDINNKQISDFISKVRPRYLSLIALQAKETYLRDIVLEALKEEGNVDINKCAGKEFGFLMHTVDMICARNYVKDTLNLPEKFFFYEADTVSSAVAKISEIITC